MLTILVADIFGNTSALQQLATQIADDNFLIIDPYAGKVIDFDNEQSAYDYFSNNVGLINYAQQLQEKLTIVNQPFNLIAFSVGGSATWLNSQWLIKSKVNRVVCFYAGQIRYHYEQQPSVNLELILPIYEAHFEINALKEKLSSKKNVTIEQSKYLHGFMNQLSVNYDLQGYQQYLTKLQSL